MLQLQLYVNHHSDLLDAALIETAVTRHSDSAVRWVSPLEFDAYREYQDAAFLEKLGLGGYVADLADFWPFGGPCWDGLALVERDRGEPAFLLVEAKSYPDEVISSIGAKAKSSIARINGSLKMAADWLGLDAVPPIWTAGRYQAANRLAHLYFLRERCGLEAALVFICFTDDPTHLPHQAVGIGAWSLANGQLWQDVGLRDTPPYTHVVYLPGLTRRQRDEAT